MIETALVLALLVVPVAIAVAKVAPTVVAWVNTTSADMKHNSELQQENNALLRELLAKQGASNTQAPPA